jgi:hypothetical protein
LYVKYGNDINEVVLLLSFYVQVEFDGSPELA